MPNLGQGGCQALEDSMVLAEELQSATKRSQLKAKLAEYRERRLVRSAAVQGFPTLLPTLSFGVLVHFIWPLRCDFFYNALPNSHTY